MKNNKLKIISKYTDQFNSFYDKEYYNLTIFIEILILNIFIKNVYVIISFLLFFIMRTLSEMIFSNIKLHLNSIIIDKNKVYLDDGTNFDIKYLAMILKNEKLPLIEHLTENEIKLVLRQYRINNIKIKNEYLNYYNKIIDEKMMQKMNKKIQ
jgi:hypothetical protein